VLNEPFSQTDKYQYTNAFLIGAKLADTYKYTDECIDAFIGTIDDCDYYRNNVTLVTAEDQKDENAFHIFLNMTGLIGGPLADILPECW
jgi:hypothetical protein